jgi:hypothetical protein
MNGSQKTSLPQNAQSVLAAGPTPIQLGILSTGIATLLFCLTFGLGLLSASAPYWSNPKGDMAVMLTGYEALLQAPWSFPLGTVTTLSEGPVSIVYTDSIPWVSLMIKAFGLSALVNPLGLFLFVSYPLQAISMVSLLRSLGVSRPWFLLGGALLALTFPPWIARQFGHMALSGHWIILYALSLSVASARFALTWIRIAGFAALAVLAVGIHAYHLVPIGAGFAAAAMAELAQDRPSAVPKVAVGIVVLTLSVAVPALLLGYGVGKGFSGGAQAMGLWSMNALGPAWPEASFLFGQTWNGEWFNNTLDPTGFQKFEGFQYLGFGGVVLVALMAMAAIAGLIRHEAPDHAQLRRWVPLAGGMVILTIWAIGPVVFFGPWRVLTAPRPEGSLGELFGYFRSHGRLFWTVGYLLIALGVTWSSRLPRHVGFGLLAAIVILQFIDTIPIRTGLGATFAAPVQAPFPDSWRTNPAIGGRPWLFVPTYSCVLSVPDLNIIVQLDLMIIRTGGRTNTTGTARDTDLPCNAAMPDVGLDATPTDRRITAVVAAGPKERGSFQAISRRSDCYRFKRGVLCGRDLAGVEGLISVSPGELAGALGR